MLYSLLVIIDRFTQFATRVWNVDFNFYSPEQTVLEAIKRLENLSKELGLPTRLKDVNIPDDRFKDMAANAVKLGSIKKMTKEDIVEIFKIAR